jgi:hypothetical protein
MILIALLFFVVNLIAVGWAFITVADAIKYAGNPLGPILVTIGLVCSMAVLGQFIARLPEDDAHVTSEHAPH